MNSARPPSTDGSVVITHQKYRPDIDGLRAIAVLAVVGFHAFPRWIKSGFIGVDIFFVISGYLISSIILHDLSHGTFSFQEFYRRRIRRIFPALLLVLSFTFFLGWIFLFPSDYKFLGKHVASGAAFVSNFALWSESGYFDGAAETKPLLHLWSLAIEEQFYVAWPLILWFAYGRKISTSLLFFVLFVASLSINIWLIQGNLTAAFYSPLSRAWELLIGAGLAKISAQPSSISSRARYFGPNTRSFAGVVLLFWAFISINSDRAFPGWWALLPAIGSALLISAGHDAFLNRKILSAKPLVWVGLISFPLYLWHWPLLVFLNIAGQGSPTRSLRIVMVSLAFVLAWLTYRFFEKPIRARFDIKSITNVLLGSMAVLGGVGYIGFLSDGFSSRFPAVIQELARPYIPGIGWRAGSCFLNPDQSYKAFESCQNSGNEAGSNVLLWGDSTAAELYPGYREYFSQYNLIQRTASACPPMLNVAVVGRPHCVEINDFVYNSVSQKVPDRVVLAAIWTNYEWSDIRGTLLKLKALGVKNIDLIGPGPEWMNTLPRQLYLYSKNIGAGEVPSRMKFGLKPDFVALDERMKLLAGDLGVNYISRRSIFCNDEGCMTQISGKLVAFDATHLTDDGSKYLVSNFPGATVSATRPASAPK